MFRFNLFSRTIVTLVTILGISLPLQAFAAKTECTAKVSGKLTPDEMKTTAKISMADAQAAALKEVGKADVKKLMDSELEVEDGCLIYSFDIRLKSVKGLEEVMVDAVSGQIVSRKHETPEQEAAEIAEDKKKAESKK